MKKVFVIGLDCAPPSIIFDKRKELPNLNKLMRQGSYGRLKTCDPPITIPAWMAMATSQFAGDMGVYGFKYRKNNAYKETEINSSENITTPAIWDIIANRGMQSCLIGIPPSYPPKEISGNLISCFMTPTSEREYTYPAELKNELELKFGKYIFDVVFRTKNLPELLNNIYKMTEKHFDVISYLIKNKPWQFFMFVEIGMDRVNHAFWRFHDRSHSSYTEDERYNNAVMDYYKFVDKRVGRLIKLLDKDTTIFVVSDHGAKAMKGVFCINQWLMEKGYLVFKQSPKQGSSIDEAEVDWRKTKAWASGGYRAKLFLNVEGREECGVIPESEYENCRDKIINEIMQIGGPNGERWNTSVLKPSDVFPVIKGNPEDLIIYLDDLNWRAGGTLNHDSLYLNENNSGPDGANHDWDGVFIMSDPKNPISKDIGGISIFDIAPTILDKLGVDIPDYMRGTSKA